MPDSHARRTRVQCDYIMEDGGRCVIDFEHTHAPAAGEPCGFCGDPVPTDGEPCPKCWTPATPEHLDELYLEAWLGHEHG